MGRLPAKVREYEITTVRSRHKEICRLIALGYENAEIAEMLGVSRALVCAVRNSSLTKEIIAELERLRDEDVAELNERIVRAAPKAFELIMQAVDPQPGDPDLEFKERIKVAQDLLDRAGYGKIQRIQSQNTNVSLTPEEIELMKQNARQVGWRTGKIVDADYSVSEASEHKKEEEKEEKDF